MGRRLQVFVSSTYEDLKPERQAAVEEILRAGHIPAGMELFAAGDESQMEVIRRWIDESDVFMLILGGRYGSVEPKSGKSYVELEYEYAASKNKPRIPVVISSAALDRRRVAEPARTEQGRVKEYEEFRKGITDGRMCAFFDDPKDIRLAVHQSLGNLLSQGGVQGGWLPARDVTDPKPLVDQIAALGAEATQLRAKLVAAENRAAKAETSAAGLDLTTIFETLEQTPIQIPAGLNKGQAATASLANLFIGNGHVFSGGTVNNAFNADEVDSFFFFTVAPRLAVFGLVKKRRPAGTKYDVYETTPLGNRLLAEHQVRATQNTPKVVYTAEPKAAPAKAQTKAASPGKASKKPSKA